jgi:hypothetical protein
MTLAPLEVVFTAEMSREYGGHGKHIHADEAVAREYGFAGIVSWGSLTIHPFVRLVERHIGTVLPPGTTVNVALRRPVCAGDVVVFGGTETGEPPARSFELTATNAAGSVVASADVRIEHAPSSSPGT